MMLETKTKLPPHDTDAEEAVVASLLIDGDAVHRVKGIVRPADFYYEQNRWLYAGCLALADRREAVDQVTLAQELARTGKLEETGGAAHLSHLISIAPSPTDIEHYANIVKRLSVARGLINVGDQIAAEGYAAPADISTSLDRVTGLMRDFRAANAPQTGLITSQEAANQMFNLMMSYREPQHSLSLGYRDIDNLTTGLYPSELVIIGGRPSVGKTQFLLDMAEFVADHGNRVLFVSAEMSMRMILERKAARELGLSVRHLRSHPLNDAQEDKLTELSGQMAERHMHYLSQGVSSSDVYDRARTLKEGPGLDVVFVDYLGKLRDAYEGHGENTNARVGRVCKVLKDITNDLLVPVVCACQLSRGVEYRDDKRPVLSDLRDSGNIEQDADIVFLLYRDPAAPDILEVIMAKHRQLGASANVAKLLWLKEQHRYVNLAQQASDL